MIEGFGQCFLAAYFQQRQCPAYHWTWFDVLELQGHFNFSLHVLLQISVRASHTTNLPFSPLFVRRVGSSFLGFLDYYKLNITNFGSFSL